MRTLDKALVFSGKKVRTKTGENSRKGSCGSASGLGFERTADTIKKTDVKEKTERVSERIGGVRVEKKPEANKFPREGGERKDSIHQWQGNV